MTTLCKTFAVVSFLVLLMAACQEPAADTPIQADESSEIASETIPTASSTSNSVVIETPDNQHVVVFHLDGEPRIEMGGQVLRSERKGDKRKYYLEGGGQVAEVKYKDDTFKVRTPSADLLWKIKLYDDKVKISDNEENLNPYTLRPRDGDRVKVQRDPDDIGQVNFYLDEGRIKVKDNDDAERFASHSDRYSSAYGVLLMDTIGPQEKYIIMAELMAMGR
jgi:hypothetical protein